LRLRGAFCGIASNSPPRRGAARRQAQTQRPPMERLLHTRRRHARYRGPRRNRPRRRRFADSAQLRTWTCAARPCWNPLTRRRAGGRTLGADRRFDRKCNTLGGAELRPIRPSSLSPAGRSRRPSGPPPGRLRAHAGRALGGLQAGGQMCQVSSWSRLALLNQN
jgi:hypothetical protein